MSGPTAPRHANRILIASASVSSRLGSGSPSSGLYFGSEAIRWTIVMCVPDVGMPKRRPRAAASSLRDLVPFVRGRDETTAAVEAAVVGRGRRGASLAQADGLAQHAPCRDACELAAAGLPRADEQRQDLLPAGVRGKPGLHDERERPPAVGARPFLCD